MNNVIDHLLLERIEESPNEFFRFKLVHVQWAIFYATLNRGRSRVSIVVYRTDLRLDPYHTNYKRNEVVEYVVYGTKHMRRLLQTILMGVWCRGVMMWGGYIRGRMSR